MSVYLHDIPLPRALSTLEQALKGAGCWGVLGVEQIPLDEHAAGRVLAEPVWAIISSPHYHASAMDGFAVRAVDTVGAMTNDPITITCSDMQEARAVYLDTGDLMPEWANAVIPIENVEPIDSDEQPAKNPRNPPSIRIRASVTPWMHVRPMGEDMVATQLVLPAGHILRAVDLGAIAASGHDHVPVARQPRVAILPTGSELIPIGQPARAGEIIEFNSTIMAAQVNAWGALATRFPIVRDDFDAICRQVQDAAGDFDLILLNAGSSAGSEDFSARVVETLGDLLVHGVAVRPGHPVILGMIRRGHEGADTAVSIPIVGVPGYPVSAALTGEIFVEPMLARWLGRRGAEPVEVSAKLTRKVTSPAGDDDYMRVAVGRVGNDILAAPLSRGSGVISSLVRADGIAILPSGSQGLPADSEVKVRLYTQPAELERTIFAIGSHDMTLDLMAQYLAPLGRRLTSANVGSLGGLVALKRGQAHMAGSHLLDPETGQYNIAYIRRYLPGQKINIVALVDRQQGLMVPKGNPKGVRSLDDLARDDIHFVNRQRGAGTRELLDYQLAQLGIAPERISGYTQEEYTHLAVAVAVASRRADCGLGIAAAAQALELDFVPLFEEHYELVIPQQFYQSQLMAPLFEILNAPTFQRDVERLPGYDTGRMGSLIAEIE